MTLVGLDVGTSGLKGIAISPEGEVLAAASESYELSTPQPGWAEQDPDDWARAARSCLAQLPPGEVGLSGQMHGLVVLDGDGDVIRPAILWNDQRTAEQCAEIESRLGLERLIALTGNRALTGFTAPKLLWLREHEPAAYAGSGTSSCRRTTCATGSTGGSRPMPRMRPGRCSSTLPTVAGRRRCAPSSRSRSSGCRPSPSRRRSAPPAIRPRPRVGLGIISPGDVSVVLGTSGVVFAPLPAYQPDREARVHVFCHAVPGTWHAMGVMLSAAGSLGWLQQILGADLATLTTEAARWPAGSEGLQFAPYLAGERTPYADPDARGAFTGLSLRHDRGALVRATLEGVAYGLRDSLELLRELGVDAQGARLSGGGGAQRALAEDRRLRARAPGRAHRDRGGLGLRRRPPRGRPRGRVRRPRGRRRALRPRAGGDRARPRLGARLRGRVRVLPRPLSGATHACNGTERLSSLLVVRAPGPEPPAPGRGTCGSDPCPLAGERVGGELGALDPGAYLRERDLPRGRGVVAER